MERTPVTSTNVRSVGYDSNSQTLEVEFNSGTVYQYAGVPEGEHDGLMRAQSKGTYLNTRIKGRYPYVRL
jgi:effector-binding domain-containing protein